MAARPREAARAGAILSTRALTKHFGGVHAVSDVDLDVGPGERVSVIGPNGAGKSTLFNLVAGEFRPSGGRVEMFGADMTRASIQKRAHRGLARTFQTSKLFTSMTVADNLYLSLCGRPGSVRRLRDARLDHGRIGLARELAERAGLGAELGVEVGELSHGQQRQLEVAMALGARPELLMLDEPAAGLSPTERRQLTTVLRELSTDVTLLLIEHDMDIALVIGERVVVMSDGEKVLEGSPSDIRSSELVRRIYLGGTLDVR